MNNLHGDHNLEFADQTEEVCYLLKLIQNNNKMNALCKALKHFNKMCQLLSLIFIDEYDFVKEYVSASRWIQITNRTSKKEISETTINLYKK